MPHPDDLVGRMQALRREKGLIDTNNIGWLDKRTGEIDLVERPHAEGDGINLVAWFLQPLGYPVDPVPMARDPEEPSFRRLRALAREHDLTRLPPARVNWKRTGPYGFQENTPVVFDWCEREETADIFARCKAAGVSFLAFSYAALNRAVGELLIEGDAPYRWFCPVNMRGARGAGPQIPNPVSALYLPARPDSTAADFARELTARLKARQYWSLWKQLQLTRFMGPRLTSGILDLIAKNSRFAGTYTTMGEWPLKGQDNPPEDPDRLLLIAGPASPTYPVSSASLTWHGQLTISLRLHRSLLVEPGLDRQVLDRFVELLRSDEILAN